MLALALAFALARHRRWSCALRILQHRLRAHRIAPRQAGHRLAGLVRKIPAARPDALAALCAELDELRFAREEPAAERVSDLIARTRALTRRAADDR